MPAELASEHFNSQNERITIERITAGAFEGQHLLCIYDDWPGRTVAMTLLDETTRAWLRRVLAEPIFDGDTLNEIGESVTQTGGPT